MHVAMPAVEAEQEYNSMCDYSLHNVASRPAKVADRLVTTRFAESITRGFAAVGEPDIAVCLLPGTEVAFEKDLEFEGGLGFFVNWKWTKRAGEKVVRFRQVHMDKPYVNHDALEFPNGDFVLLTRLCEGQVATVLQLPALPRGARGAKGADGAVDAVAHGRSALNGAWW